MRKSMTRIISLIVLSYCAIVCVSIRNTEEDNPLAEGDRHLELSSAGTPNQVLIANRPWSQGGRSTESSGGVSAECMELLDVFSNATSAYLECVMTNARPLHYCENCIKQFTSAANSYDAICEEKENDTTCKDELLRADNVQVVLVVYDFVESVWDKSTCHNCYNVTVENDTTIYSPTKETLEMLERIQETQDCFHDFADDHTENVSVCLLCKKFYCAANTYYEKLDEEGKLCSDLEDSMNYTRRMWSKDFKCTVAVRKDLVIYGISVAIGFLPLFFYVGIFVYGKRRERRQHRRTEDQDPSLERNPINLQEAEPGSS